MTRTRQTITTITTCALVITAVLFRPIDVKAQTMADYTAVPPFVSENAVPPNVLLLLDNSGSMNTLAYQSSFDPAKTYFGLFDHLECYTYGSNKFQPDPAALTVPELHQAKSSFIPDLLDDPGATL